MISAEGSLIGDRVLIVSTPHSGLNTDLSAFSIVPPKPTLLPDCKISSWILSDNK
jgi:hypothetical protein